MSKKAHKSLADLIGTSNSGLGRLADVARQKASLSDYLRKSLDPELVGGFVHCNIREDGTLVVFASSSAWAARLRFAAQHFTDLCVAQGLQVHSVKVRVSS